jgi:hypothetical protein
MWGCRRGGRRQRVRDDTFVPPLAIILLTEHRDNPAATVGYLRDLSRMTGERKLRLFLGKRVRVVEGSYYGTLIAEAQDQGRVLPIPVDKAQPVDVSWDFGVADFTTSGRGSSGRGRSITRLATRRTASAPTRRATRTACRG